MAWQDIGESPAKDSPMEMTQDNFMRVIGMHDELIHEQREEISKLKARINKLELKLKSRINNA